jgi:hypothetical protein
MYKSMVHPDPRRNFGVLAVVAIDAQALELSLVAGTEEPASHTVRRDERSGLIPKGRTNQLVAAFNGGFKATHGRYGMMIDGVEFLAPRTFARMKDDGLLLGTWSAVNAKGPLMRYYRQTPPCLVENGQVHERLVYEEYAKGWGATISGDTIIRRSAVGLSADGKTILYGLGEAMTAQALARGMKAAGAHAAAELDVNHSYPRFLFYERRDPGEPPVATSAIIEAIDFHETQYVSQPSVRDFFYLTRRTRTAGRDGDGAKAVRTASN